MNRYTFQTLFVSVLLAGLILPIASWSQTTPRLINYDGRLVIGDLPVSGSHTLAFTLYGDSEGGNFLWTETHNVNVTDGLFSLLLGSQANLPQSLFRDNDELYLGISVDGGPEMTPRLRMASTAFALRSAFADQVRNGSISTANLTDGAVTTAKLSGTAAVLNINGVSGSIRLEGGSNVSVTEDDGTFIISAAGGQGGGGDDDDAITSIDAEEGLTVDSDDDEVTIGIADGGVTAEKLASTAAVKRLNGLTGDFSLVAGEGIEISEDDGDIRITNTRVFSSIRWKEDVQPLENALNTVTRLQGVSYRWKETGIREIGLIAEEVGAILPEIVEFEEDGEYARTVDYSRLVAVLIEAVKEQQKQVAERDRVIADILARVESLEREPEEENDPETAAQSSHSDSSIR